MQKKYVPDTSALINGVVSKLIDEGKIKGTIIIPRFVISELENQANRGRETGYLGLEEIKAIVEREKKGKIKVEITGRAPTLEEIQLAKSGRIDFLIREIAYENKAVLITSDMVQAKVAEALGMEVMFFEKEVRKEPLFIKYFDEHTASVHLKEGTTPKAKKGMPGNMKLVELSKEVMSKEQLEEIIKDILDITRVDDKSYVEINRYEAMVIQHREYRIAIARPPFSDALEVTIVRPVFKLSLDDYKLHDKLINRLKEKAEGIIIAGPPGHGKTTFAQALAEFYLKQGKIVKTMEHPRDLQVPPDITQYAPLQDSMENTADILLLVRPDYTIYDEVRKTKDFRLFADLRMAGVGMIGVVHASKAIEAVQRFMGRVELGLIPQIVDTVIFIKNGRIEKIYVLNLTVRTPTGMTESDLARPIVEVRDFETEKLEYEIYTYGEQTVVMDVNSLVSEDKNAIEQLAEDAVRKEIAKYAKDAEILLIQPNKAIVRVEEKDIAGLIGKKGKTIQKIEDKLGLKIEVEPKSLSLKKEVEFEVKEKGAYIVLIFDESLTGKNVDIYVDDEYLFSATIGKKGMVKVKKTSDHGKKLIRALARGSVVARI
ncbi:MAG: Flp pilus assembly complex ATPase component [Candidatus Nanohaloarchaeota archaeon]|nr:Flp pilus assembly complex ATPase component [Candidatus Nanohaloarchaeota archaeon]